MNELRPPGKKWGQANSGSQPPDQVFWVVCYVSFAISPVLQSIMHEKHNCVKLFFFFLPATLPPFSPLWQTAKNN